MAVSLLKKALGAEDIDFKSESDVCDTAIYTVAIARDLVRSHEVKKFIVHVAYLDEVVGETDTEKLTDVLNKARNTVEFFLEDSKS